MLKDQEIAAAILGLLSQCGPGKSICPSQAARVLADDWRPLMPAIRRVAAEMDNILATQRGIEVDPRVARGPIRLCKTQDPG